MVRGDVVAYNVASFICALFVLELGADKFIDHTVVVADRLHIPQGIIALLTAGAEWEELAVVVVSLARGRSSLAVGNVVGSAISNILGAFSLGLLLHPINEPIVYDLSSRSYTLLLLILSALVTLTYPLNLSGWWRIFGGVLIGIFVVYIVSIAWLISKGHLNAPEDSDSDSDDDEEEQRGNDREDDSLIDNQDEVGRPHTYGTMAPADAPVASSTSNYKHSIIYHVVLLVLGLIAIVISSYVLSTAATNIIDELGISDVLVGMVILSIATTLPEKLIAIISGHKGHTGILVANTVGSNIFLLTLCLGILWVCTDGDFDHGTANVYEWIVMLGSTVAMTLTVWVLPTWNRWIGALMLLCYIAFIVLEITLIRKV